MQASALFVFPDFPFLNTSVFNPQASAWDWIQNISKVLETFDFRKNAIFKQIPPGLTVGKRVYIHETVKLPPYGVIEGPCYIGANTEIRPGAIIGPNVIIGQKCVIGNSTALENCLLLDEVKLPHFNYVWSAVLGNKVNFGAGAVISSFSSDDPTTRKTDLGALIGDAVSIGCHAVMRAGAIILPKVKIYPLTSVPENLMPKTFKSFPKDFDFAQPTSLEPGQNMPV
jgi:NDP-sugar pyrophosphorylase family protein